MSDVYRCEADLNGIFDRDPTNRRTMMSNIYRGTLARINVPTGRPGSTDRKNGIEFCPPPLEIWFPYAQYRAAVYAARSVSTLLCTVFWLGVCDLNDPEPERYQTKMVGLRVQFFDVHPTHPDINKLEGLVQDSYANVLTALDLF